MLKYGTGIGMFGALAPGEAAAEDVSSKNPPSDGFTTESGGLTTQTTSQVDGSSEALIVRDCSPWGVNANEIVLGDIGTSYAVINSADLSSTDLGDYQLVVLPSTQSSSYYDNLTDSAGALDTFVNDGGTLIGHVADSGYPCTTSWNTSFLPDGVDHQTTYLDSLRLVDDSHTRYDGVSDGALDGWNYSSHGYLTDLPSGASTLVTGSSGNPTHVEYSVGDGTVIATMQTLEWPFVSSYGTQDVLYNELEYAADLQGPVELSVDARIVQTVENSRVENPDNSEVIHKYDDETPLIAKKNTVPIIDVSPANSGDSIDPSDLPDPTTITFEIEETDEDVNGRTRTFTNTDDYTDDGTADDVPGLVSRMYDLTDGQFDQNSFDQSIESFMSYSYGDTWADQRIFEALFDNDFDPHPEEMSSRDPYGRSSISGTALVRDDGAVELLSTEQVTAAPMADADSGSTTMTVRDASGGTLSSFTVEDERFFQGGGHPSNVDTDAVTFTLPFPEEAYSVSVDNDGTVSEFTPHSAILFEALSNVPDRAFVKNPDERRAALEDKFDAVENQLENRAFRGCYNKLTKDVRKHVDAWIRAEYETNASEYTKVELLALVDDLIDRVETLRDAAPDKGGGPENGGNGPGKGDRSEKDRGNK